MSDIDLPRVECQYCGEKYTTRGIHSHEEYCDENPNPPEDPASDPEETPDKPADPDPDDPVGSADPESDPIDVCPSCGNRDDDRGEPIAYANDAAERALVDDGPLAESERAAIRENDLICLGCGTAFASRGHA